MKDTSSNDALHSTKVHVNIFLYYQENSADPNSIQQFNLLRRFKKENKTAITIFAIIGAFLLCWAPFCCVNFTAALFDYEIPRSVDVFCTLLVAVGSSVNPILYGWLDMAFRSAFKRLLTPIFHPCVLRRVPRIRNGLHPLPGNMPFYIQILSAK